MLVFASGVNLEVAERLAHFGQWPFIKQDTISRLPGMLAGWSSVRGLAPLPLQSFREWWAQRAENNGGGAA